MLFDGSTRGAVLESEPFLYAPMDQGAGQAYGLDLNPALGVANFAKAQAEKAEREAYEKGLREGEARASVQYQSKTATLTDGVGKALAGFRTDREEYFNQIEPEVVQLALAIAKKILHREVQIDPLLLTGLVRVALDKLQAGTQVRLRANPVDIPFWKEYFTGNSTGEIAPEIVGDHALPQGECALEAEVGSTHISLDIQLKEIEQGFFDLLELRPRPR